VCRFGVATAYDPGQAAMALRGRDVTLTVDLGVGSGEATFLTCDLTHDYVTINAEYTT
jgi:glutamate N-acetyltransferase/amino-acid N-acetyltransferase